MSDGADASRRTRRLPAQEGGPNRPLAAAIRLARRRADLSQGELAERLGIRQSSVSQWERGTTEPTGRRLVDLIGELPGLADMLKEMSGLRVVAELEPGSSTNGSSGRP